MLSFCFEMVHKQIGIFSNVSRIIFTVRKLCMLYFIIFIILQDVYNQLIANIWHGERVVRYENHIILVIE